MTSNEQFFYDHAGFSYDPKTETEEQGKGRRAREMARAEQYGREHGWVFEWRDDQDADHSFVEGWTPEEQAEWREVEHEALFCVLKDTDGKVLESLGGIFDPTTEYGRVVEAELASEALDQTEPGTQACLPISTGESCRLTRITAVQI